MSKPDTSGHSQHRVFAESYILRCIGKFDDAAQHRLMEACPGSPYKNADAALDDFESSESITEAQVEWIKDAWSKHQDKKSNPQRFAAEVANQVFHDIEF